MRSSARNLCVPAALLLSLLAPSLALAAVPALPSEPLARLRAEQERARRLPSFAPGQVLVRFHDSVTAGVEGLFQRRGSFREGTADRSGSLDAVFRELGVQAVTPVFRAAEEAPVPLAELRRRETGGAELVHVYRLELGPGVATHAAVAALRRDPHVVYAEPNGLSFTQALPLPDDPLIDPTGQDVFRAGGWFQRYADLWGMERSGWGEVWRRQDTLWADPARRGGGGVVVAVIDTGVDVDHPDLAANVWRDAEGRPGRDTVHVPTSLWPELARFGFARTPGEDYRTPDFEPTDKFGHGTHVAGTIAAVADNQEGIAGIAWGARLMPVRAGFAVRDTLNQINAAEGLLLQDNIAAAIRWATDHWADVINMSFGGVGASETVRLAVAYAHARGVVLVAAAGNSGVDVKDVFPASFPHVVSVAATQTGDRRASFSNWGTGIDLAAPGTDIASLTAEGTRMPGGGSTAACDRCLRVSGTSMAAPHVAGAAALILSVFPSLGPEAVAARLVGTADPVVPFIARDAAHLAFGGGRLNLLRALTARSRPAVLLRSWQMLAESDGDGSAEPGEDVRLLLRLDNVWRPAKNVSLELVTGPEAVVVAGGTRQVASWPMGTSQEMTVDLKIGSAVPRGLEGALQVALRGGVRQDLPVPMALHGPGRKPGWPVYGRRVGDGMVTSSVLADLDGDGDREVLSVSDQGDMFARQGDGSALPGWPLHVASFLEQSSPLVEDLDRDGEPEIVVVREKQIHLFDPQGRELPGWPRPVDDYVLCSPAAGDVDGDGAQEIVVLDLSGALRVFDRAGRLLPGWPKSLGTVSNTTPVLAELDAAGAGLEILAAGGTGRLSAWRGDGTPAAGAWPAAVTPWGPASPAVGDVDADGAVEIVAVTADGLLYRIDVRGTARFLASLPGTFSFSSPALGDLDGDGHLEIAVASGQNDGTGAIAVYDAEGHLLPGWPVTTTDQVAASPALADLDGDGHPEIVVPDLSGELWALRRDGHPLGGWPFDVEGWALSSPVVADLDGDGTPEIVQGRITLGLNRTPVVMTYALEFGEGIGAPWPAFKGASQRRGLAPSGF